MPCYKWIRTLFSIRRQKNDNDDDYDDDDENNSSWIYVYILFAFIHSEIADLNQKFKAVKVAIVLVLADNTILI